MHINACNQFYSVIYDICLAILNQICSFVFFESIDFEFIEHQTNSSNFLNRWIVVSIESNIQQAFLWIFELLFLQINDFLDERTKLEFECVVDESVQSRSHEVGEEIRLIVHIFHPLNPLFGKFFNIFFHFQNLSAISVYDNSLLFEIFWIIPIYDGLVQRTLDSFKYFVQT